MPSFKAVLQVSGKQYDIYHSEYNLRQLIDELGRPASPTLGGGFVLDIEEPSETDSLIYDWMFSPIMQLNGQVVLWDMDKKKLKVVKFHHAFLVNLRSLFDGTGHGAGSPSKRTQLTISPQASDNNGQFHDNNWPAPDPIVDWDWTTMNAQCNPDAKKQKEPSALSEGLHTLLDVVGMIPIVGEIADGANAAIYAAEGDYTNAALSAAAMIPIAGNVAGAAKLAKRGAKLIDKVRGLKKAKRALKTAGKQVKKATDAVLDLSKKPKYSPDVKKWQAKGGTVETLTDGSWKYTNKEGVSVTYKNGYPDFKPHSRQQIDIEVAGNHTTDFTKADKAAPLGKKLSTSTWHHHENMRTMEEVSRKIHRQFTHAGGVAKIKKKGVSVKIKKK